jgi:uncharacterized protein YdiU (UPF0061 family)
MTIHPRVDNSYARLPQRFSAKLPPAPAPAPSLIRVNRPLALDLGIDPDWLAGPEGVAMVAGNALPDWAEPLAMAYAGHQFGGFSSQLGDGRALLLAEVIDVAGRRRDIHLKGSGRTPFSRGGDGRAALGPVLREFVVSEAMAALGVPTTRTLAAVTTGDEVIRETMLPGAVLARVAASHIRVGTFQFFAARGDVEAVKILADHVIARHYPQAAEAEKPYRALLDHVIAAQADLIPRWLLIGFIHGVMNTDNTAISGETIDYGPCAFLDEYEPTKVFSSIDQNGRYAYANQPRIALWNLTRLAEALLPLLDEDQDRAVAEAEAALSAFAPRFERVYRAGLSAKIGLDPGREESALLASDLLDRMAANSADFTLVFRRLADAAADVTADGPVRDLFIDPTAFDEWATRWRERAALERVPSQERRAAMRAVNPAFIPRNHRIEAVIRAAVDRGDFTPFHDFMEVLSRPFDDQPDNAAYADPPERDERVLRTFCGT